MSWIRRLSNVVRGRDLNPEIDEELQFHLDAATDANVAAGMTPDEARRDALRRFGSRAGIRERTRDANVVVAVERVWRDIRQGARLFARNPALTAIAVISIAFGTGANVAIFSMADALLLRPLPVLRPGELVTVGSKVLYGTIYQNLASYPDYHDIRDRATCFDGLLAYEHEIVGIASHAGAVPRARFATFVSPNFFDVLGVTPPIGRGFLANEDGTGGRGAVAVISDALWQSEYGADPRVLGRTVRVAGREFTIVGVAPATFNGLHTYVRDTVFLPVGMLPRLVSLQRSDMLDARDVRTLTVKGRLRPGVTRDEAQAELTAIGRDLERLHPETNTNVALVAQTELEYRYQAHPIDSSLVVILTVLAIAVLAVACANVAGLLASRGPARAREMALRLAIGASRGGLVRQLMAESLAIAVAGTALGLVVGRVGIVLLHQIRFPTELAAPPHFEMDQRTLAFSLVAAVVSTLAAGLGPALQTTRVDLVTSLKSADRTNDSRHWPTGRALLVMIQVALCLVLLTLSVFSVQVFSRELTAGPGFRTTNLVKAMVFPNQAGYTDAASADFFTRVLDEARRLPGVRSAAVASAMPLGNVQFVPILRAGEQPRRGEVVPPVWANSIDEQFFDTMGIPVLRGRAFDSNDDEHAPAVAIVNDTLARHFWPGETAIGKRIRVLESARPLAEIVGVVKTTTMGYPGELPQNAVYFPYRQHPRGQMTLIARTDGESAAILKPIAELPRRLDVDVPVFDALTIETFYTARVTAMGNVLVRLAGGMGLMGMLLTIAGLYGLVSYAVSRRTREIGIRIAVGASYGHIVRMVLRQGMTPAWSGVVFGLGLSVISTHLMARLVPFSYRVGPRTYYLVVPMIVAVTLVAAFIPARRASKVNPTDALRCE